MASTQRAKFRTTDGCCICRRKSSSSRFAPSTKWEPYFEGCFELGGEKRTGLMCNACVLIVKRHKAYLRKGHIVSWAYVVDCRLGPGTKNMSKIKKKMTTGGQTLLPYLAGEEDGAEQEEGHVTELGDLPAGCHIRCSNWLPCLVKPEKSRRTTVLLSTKMKKALGLPTTAARKVQWSELVQRRVMVPPHVPCWTHPSVEGYQTCCGIIYISPDCSTIWAEQEYFQQCQALHPIPGKFQQYQRDGCPAFAARISELHLEISAQRKMDIADLLSCADDIESACSPSSVASDPGVEVSSEASAHSTVLDSLEFSEHDDFGTNPSSPASAVGMLCGSDQSLYENNGCVLDIVADGRLSSHHQLPLSVTSISAKVCFPYEA